MAVTRFDVVTDKVLIVDDEPTVRLLLKSQLVKQGYEVIMAENGEEGVRLFESEKPDIVFMDIMMPVMDGYEATRRIKALMNEQFVPIIFLTSVSNEKDIIKCFLSGGDDVVAKPFSISILNARINAIQRIRDLHRTIQRQHDIMLHDEQMAEEIFADVVMANNVELDTLKVLLKPAVTFSGDLLLTARSPGGELYVLMGDFTGHGLAAAIGAFPASQIFQSMAKKGFSPSSILHELNSKLYHILPTDMFFAACLISISPLTGSVSVWNGGLPDVLVVRPIENSIVSRISSTHLALGIVENFDDSNVTYIDVEEGDQIVVLTDGVTEAVNEKGEQYSEQRLEKVLCNHGGDPFKSLVSDHERFVDSTEQADDISLVAIPCGIYLKTEIEGESLHAPAKQISLEEDTSGTDWVWSCELSASSLKNMDPVPVLLGQLQEFADLSAHRKSLFTVLAELYNNALDHGILGLESYLKSTPDGFTRFLELREDKMAKLNNAYIKIRFEKKMPVSGVSRLYINVEDSGGGFDYDEYISSLDVSDRHSGRGIRLIEELCETVRYIGNGNKVEVVFAWDEVS